MKFSVAATKRLLALALVSSIALSAQMSPVLAGTVKLAGHSTFNITTASGGASAASRTSSVQRNLDNALVATSNRSPSAVGVVHVKGVPVITLGGFYVT